MAIKLKIKYTCFSKIFARNNENERPVSYFSVYFIDFNSSYTG